MRWLIIAVMVVGTSAAAKPHQYFVSVAGNDAWSGRLEKPNAEATDGPFATLERARDSIRALKTSGGITGPIEVVITRGMYSRDVALELTNSDSGTKESPIVWRGESWEVSRIVGGRRLTISDRLTDPAILARLDETARGKILTADIRPVGLPGFGELRSRGFGRAIQTAALELFANGKAMQLARWPNDGYTKITAVPHGSDSGKFNYEDDRPTRWKTINDVWIHGYWTWDWAESYEHVKHIDTGSHEIETYPPHGVYGYKEGRRFYYLNVLEELDQPGEWYLDRELGQIYVWPLDEPRNTEFIASTLETPIVVATDVSFVTFRDLSFECGRDAGVKIIGGQDVLIEHCRFANLGTLAASIEDGANVSAGKGNGIRDCEIYGTGEGGIYLAGGDRPTLTPGGNFATGNRIHDFSRWVFTYRPGVMLDGVGNRVANNEIFDAPHTAILFGGNEHLIEYNDIHHVCMDTHDAGAIYIGRDWTMRGNTIRYNYLHELGNGDVNAIYLDDWTSGTTIYGNICVRAGRGVLLGGGRDNTIENNIFIECRPGIHIDARGLGWAKNYFDGTTKTLFERFDAMHASEPPYSEKYPELKTILNDEPAIPKGNRVLNNINFGGRWLDLLDGMNDTIIKFENNWTEGDPGFDDKDKGMLRPDSAAYAKGFKAIQFDRIGPKSGISGR
jgi:parallel beta-helix repeat protein